MKSIAIIEFNENMAHAKTNHVKIYFHRKQPTLDLIRQALLDI